MPWLNADPIAIGELKEMKHQGRSVIRINDMTDHGGTVISATSHTVVMGLQAALEGDMTICPRCKGNFAIKTDKSGAKYEGRHYAYDQDMTECGARLIASLAFSGATGGTRATANSGSRASGFAEPNAVMFNDKFSLLDELSGTPLSHRPYAIRRAAGHFEFGTTDANGSTHLLSSEMATESIDIFL